MELNNIPNDLKNFFENNNFINKNIIEKIIADGENHYTEIQSRYNEKIYFDYKDFISLFSYRFIPEIFRKIGFHDKTKSKIYQFSAYENLLKIVLAIKRLYGRSVYLSTVDEITTNSFSKSIMNCVKFTEITNLHFSVDVKFLMVSQERLNYDDVVIITKLYDDIKKYEEYFDKSIIIYVTLNNTDGYNILSTDKSNFNTRFISPKLNYEKNSGQKFESIEIDGLRNSKFMNTTGKYFYNFYYRQIFGNFTFKINTPTLDITLLKKKVWRKTTILIFKIKNNLTFKKYKFILKFIDQNLHTIFFNRIRIVNHKNIITHLINSIYSLYLNPFSELKIMSIENFSRDNILFASK
ncbi:hypothetical protein DMUE_4850 [Dictyocoela muelleri]|nr:hypothetical protein DMUE_4850 [Dictyocoela muelleri]